jgi:hypothetical protein
MNPMVNLSNKGSATQILGRMGVNRFEGKRGMAELYAPYFTNYQEFLTAYGFKPINVQANSLQGVKVDQTLCDGVWLNETATIWPGVQQIFLRPGGISENPFLRRLELRGANGELGRLYAHALPEQELRSTFFGGRTWNGYYRGDMNSSTPITLYFEPIIGDRFQCVLPEKL